MNVSKMYISFSVYEILFSIILIGSRNLHFSLSIALRKKNETKNSFLLYLFSYIFKLICIFSVLLEIFDIVCVLIIVS